MNVETNDSDTTPDMTAQEAANRAAAMLAKAADWALPGSMDRTNNAMAFVGVADGWTRLAATLGHLQP